MKDSKFEAILFLVFDVIVMILGILIKVGYLKLKDGFFYGKHDVFAGVLIVVSFILLIYGLKKLLDVLKLEKSSLKDFNNTLDSIIENKLSVLGYDSILIDKKKDRYFIELDFNNVIYSLYCFCDVVNFEIECKPWYADGLTEEVSKIEDINESYNPLVLSKDEILNKFINFVMTNKF